jgi:ubiquinol-cytochrome c reductase cytochrome b subunit
MSFCTWFSDRTGLGELRQRMAAAAPAAGRCRSCRVLPCVIGVLFWVEAITGFFLWCFYSPSAQTAWESVYYLQEHVAGGRFLRAMHHYTAHVLLAAIILYILQSIVRRAYRPPHELVFWVAVAMGLFALAAVLTGDLLAWDQNGYAATKTRTGFLALLPWVGNDLLKIAVGEPGPALGHLTLTRFFALHVGIFAAGFLVLLVLHRVFSSRADQIEALNAANVSTGGACGTRAIPKGTVPFSSNENRDSPLAPRPSPLAPLLAILTVAAIAAAAYWQRVPLLSPADTDPANAYAAARPEWFLTGVYEFSHFFTGAWQIVPIFVVPGLLVCLLLAMPFLAKRPLGQAFNVLLTLVVLVAIVGMTYYSLAKDRADPVYQRAVAIERQQASRTLALIQHAGGIPPTGALTLLRNDPVTQGPILFARHCAACHDHAVVGRNGLQDIHAEKSTAPNLAGYASRPWLAGLLDPKQINGPQYFGNTKFRGGKMPGFVKENLSNLDAKEKQNLDKVIMALSAEAALPSQRELDANAARSIEEGRRLLVEEFDCTDCHKFHDKGKLGKAPELTGFGSRQWLAGMIRNPADIRRYGKLNDRMPAYAASSDPALNTLSEHDLEMLVAWLRGEINEEPGARD